MDSTGRAILVHYAWYAALSASYKICSITGTAVVFYFGIFHIWQVLKHTVSATHRQAESLLICQEMEKDLGRCGNKPRVPNEYSSHSSLTLRWAYPWPRRKAAWIIISTYSSRRCPYPDQAAPGLAQPHLAWDQRGERLTPGKTLPSEVWSPERSSHLAAELRLCASRKRPQALFSWQNTDSMISWHCVCNTALFHPLHKFVYEHFRNGAFFLLNQISCILVILGFKDEPKMIIHGVKSPLTRWPLAWCHQLWHNVNVAMWYTIGSVHWVFYFEK